jgi:hypothetical protein
MRGCNVDQPTKLSEIGDGRVRNYIVDKKKKRISLFFLFKIILKLNFTINSFLTNLICMHSISVF